MIKELFNKEVIKEKLSYFDWNQINKVLDSTQIEFIKNEWISTEVYLPKIDDYSDSNCKFLAYYNDKIVREIPIKMLLIDSLFISPEMAIIEYWIPLL